MTTKFKVNLNGHGNHSEALLQIIGNHNAGLAKVAIEDLAGYVKARVCQYPTLFQDVVIPNEDEHTIGIAKNKDEQPYLYITECIYEELKDTPPTLERYAIENISQGGEQC